MAITGPFLSSLVNLVEKSAPSLATMIVGPAGGMAVSLIESAFGIHPSDDHAAAISADPDHDLKLKKIETDHIEALKALSLQAQKLDVDDMASARNREVELAKVHSPNFVMNAIAYAVVIAFFAYVVATVLKFIPNDNTVFNQLANMVSGLIAYYFAKSHQ